MVAKFSIKDRKKHFFLRWSYYVGLPLVNFTGTRFGKRIGKKKKIVQLTLMNFIFRNYPFFPKNKFHKIEGIRMLHLQKINSAKIITFFTDNTSVKIHVFVATFFEKNINGSMTGNELLYILLLLNYLTKHVLPLFFIKFLFLISKIDKYSFSLTCALLTCYIHVNRVMFNTFSTRTGGFN